MKKNDLKELSKKYRKEIFEKFLLIKQGHPGSIFSMMEIAVTLFHGGYVWFDEKKKKFIEIYFMKRKTRILLADPFAVIGGQELYLLKT